MDSIFPSQSNPLVSTSTPVFGDNVQQLLSAGLLNINPTATIVVNSINDVPGQTGVTTLRDAINKANTDPGEDLIVFDRSKFSNAQTITLSRGELDITHTLDIIAPKDELTGADLVTVSGNNASRVFGIAAQTTVNIFGLIVANGSVNSTMIGGAARGGGISNSGTLTLDNGIVANGSANIGGGISNSGTLTLNNSIVRNSSAKPAPGFRVAPGGGIANTGILTLNNSTVSSNSANIGGGIVNGNTLTLNNSTVSGNMVVPAIVGLTEGGGIYSIGTLTVNNSTISSNSGGVFGGGISIETSSGVLPVRVGNNPITTISNSHISSNSGGNGGGIFGNGTLTISNTTISGNSSGSGGGFSFGFHGGNAQVSSSTISGNSATSNGGGIFILKGNVQVSDSTISGNSAVGNGGGIYSSNGFNSGSGGILTLVFSTVTLNTAANGGGVFQDTTGNSQGSTSVRNTIIAANLVSGTNGVNPDVSGNFISNGYNLIGDGTGSTGFDKAKGDIFGTSDSPIDPHLGVLAFNGGRTQTIALLPGSPAINAGDPTILPTDPKTDQRGKPRVRRRRADIGAFESSLKM